jgi:tetratricopeptide (TPR) repeat protein
MHRYTRSWSRIVNDHTRGIYPMDHERETRVAAYRQQSSQADDLHRSGDTKAALQVLSDSREIAKAAGDEDYSLFFEAEVTGYGGDYSASAAIMQKAFDWAVSAALAPDHFLLRCMGVYHTQSGDNRSGTKWLKQALDVNDNDSDAMRDLGTTLTRIDDYETAMEWYEKALKVNPSDYRVVCNRGSVLARMGQNADAIECYNDALALHPGDPVSHDGFALAALHLGRFDDAFDHIKRAAELAPARYRADFYFVYAAAGRVPETSWQELGIDEDTAPVTKDVELDELRGFIYGIRQAYANKTEDFLEKKKQAEEAKRKFLLPDSELSSDRSVLLLLRRWNSYTPAVPGTMAQEALGGGYFIWHKGQGTVVDPGYDFLDNFETAGGRICDIHNVILTHAHPDHTADLERLCTLLHEYHEEDEPEASKPARAKHRVRFFLSNGALVKFSGMLPLRGVNYIERVDTLTPGCEFDLADEVKMRVLRAWHDDVLARDQSVGLSFDIGPSWNPRTVLFTSDTGLFPLKREGSTSPDTSRDEVWAGYPHENGAVVPPDLMIIHIGSIKDTELEVGRRLEPEEACYANHLGIIGTARLITKCRPRLAVVSEFGEEMRDFRTTLIEGLQENVVNRVFDGKPQDETPRVVPGDLPFIYDLAENTVYDCVGRGWIAPHEVGFTQVDKEQVGTGPVYYHRAEPAPEERRLISGAKHYLLQIESREGLYFKEQV